MLLRRTRFSVFTGLVLSVLLSSENSYADSELLAMDRPNEALVISPYQLPDTQGTIQNIPASGKLTILNFWATFCGPCRQEMPALNRLWDKYKNRGLEVQAVALDGDRKTAIEKFVKRFNLTLPIYLDDDSDISKDYKVSMLPVTYLISPEGTILGRMVGEREWDSPAAYDLIESFL